MYNVYSFLEPLGLLGETPIPKPIAPPPPSQEPAGDPWEYSFPPDRQTYKLHDEEDDTYRCPACLHEIYDDRCDHCDAEFSGSDDNDDFEIGELEFEGDDVVGARAGGLRIRRRGARVNIAHVDEVLGDSEEDTPATRRQARMRRQEAERNGMFFDDEAEDVDQDMDGSGSESEDSETSEFARPRTNPSAGSEFDYDSDPLPPAVGQAGGARQRDFDRIYDQSDEDDDVLNYANGRPVRARQPARRIGSPVDDPIVRRARQAVNRVARHYIDSEADDESDDNDGAYDMRAGSVYDSDEDDGSVPRPQLRRYARPDVINVNSDGDEEEEEDEDSSAYEDSFIDDEVEEGDEESNDTENENHAEEMIQLGFSDHEEERAEDGAGRSPNIQEIRRRRLQALVDGM